MKIDPSRRCCTLARIVEFVIVTALCALWLLAFTGILYLFAMALVFL